MRGYGDELGSVYSYTNTVANSKRIKRGDVLIVRDEDVALGLGVVDQVVTSPATVEKSVCPECTRAKVRKRARQRPPYRCDACKAEFDEPMTSRESVTRYEAFYSSNWEPLARPIPKSVLKDLYEKGDGQNAIHLLNRERASAFVRREASVGFSNDLAEYGGPIHAVDQTRVNEEIQGGRRQQLTQVRNGQSKFRQALIAKYGEACAITGPYPVSGLEAAHIVSFAEREEHRVGDGFLLRADLHRLFDAKRLAVDTSGDEWTVVLSPELRDHPAVRSLHGQRFDVPKQLRPRAEALEDHRRVCESSWSEERRQDYLKRSRHST